MTQTIPSGFVVELPSDWQMLDLDIAHDASRLREMLESNEKIDGALADEAIDLLQSVALDAIAQGAVYLAMTSYSTPDYPVAASLVVSRSARVDAESRLSVEALSRRLHAATATVEETQLGRAIRLAQQAPVAFPGLEETGRCEQVQYLVPIPQSTDLLVFAFSTPNLMLAKPFTRLFDAIAKSAHWN